MRSAPPPLHPGTPRVVGSFGNATALTGASPEDVAAACDFVEVRLDLLDAGTRAGKPWRRFAGMPLLFTARRVSEGGAGDLDARARSAMLREVLDDAAYLDIELASLGEMRPLLAEIKDLGLPWIASFHDFRGMPDLAVLHAGREEARQNGAAAFKAAVTLGWEVEKIAPLALFLQSSPDFPVSLMGMGPLAPTSRLLFAQLGSVLNYGYLGDTPTAPGQWSARRLREAIDASDVVRPPA